MSDKDNSKLGEEIKNIVEDSIRRMDFEGLNRKIGDTVNHAVSEAKNAIDMSQFSVKNLKKQNEIVKSKPQQIRIPYKEKGSVSGVVASVFGSIGLFLFGTSSIVLSILAMAFEYTPVFFFIVLGLAPFLMASILLLGNGIRLQKQARRSKRYFMFLKEKGYCSIESLSARMGLSSKKVRDDIKKMLSRGIFPQGALDEKETCFIGNEEYYGQYLETLESYKQRIVIEKQREVEEKIEEHPEDIEQTQKIDLVLAEGRRNLEEIKKVQSHIYEPEFSEKLQRLQTIVEQIFKHVREYPEQIEEIRKFMEYYLPTTLKLVRAYENFSAQPIQGENIMQAKQEIRKTLGTINEAFERLLDSLYENVTMDVSTDISVLQTMLVQEGLAESDFKL